MQPLFPVLAAAESQPNVDLLQRNGWSVNTISGAYCSAWKGRDEVVFQWRNGHWHRVGGRGGVEEV